VAGVFAVIKKPNDRAVMCAFFAALIKENGAAFGLQLFGSLTANTCNYSEHYIPKEVVHKAYRRSLKRNRRYSRYKVDPCPSGERRFRLAENI